MLFLSLSSTLAELKRGEEIISGLQSSKASCFSAVFENLTRGCNEIEPHSAPHNVLALELTNCYREEAGLLPIICAVQLTVDSSNSAVAKCLKQLSKLDHSETVLQLFAIEADRVIDSCFYLNFQRFQQEQRQASTDLLDSARQAHYQLSATNQIEENLEQNIEENVEITKQISDFLKLSQAQEVMQLQNSNSLLKQIMTASQKSNEQLAAFQQAYENVSDTQIHHEERIVSHMIDIGVSLEQAAGDVGNIASLSQEAGQTMGMISNSLTEYLTAQIKLQEGINNISLVATSIEKQLIIEEEHIADSRQTLEEHIGEINQEISNFKKTIQGVNSKFSILGVLNRTPNGFINFHSAVLLSIIIADFFFDIKIGKRVATIFALNELVLNNVVRSACESLYCNVFIPLYCHLCKGQLMQLNKADLLSHGSYSVYLYLKLFKVNRGARCNDVISELGTSFSTQWLVYLERILELVVLLKLLAGESKRENTVPSFYKTFFTPNATKIKHK